MSLDIYGDFALERKMKEHFGVTAEVGQVIAGEIDVSRTAKASVFLTKKKQLICYIEATSGQTLSDVQKIISRMGLRAEQYMPPKGQPHYFDDIGREKFREVFPGRGHITDQDIVFYRTLAPYNPALVFVGEVKDGHVYQYDADSKSSWRVAAKFAYRRIKTS